MSYEAKMADLYDIFWFYARLSLFNELLRRLNGG